jgi:hypothetical protein
MSDDSSPTSVTPGAGGGTTGAKYYTTLRLFKYESPEPFRNSRETPTHTINLPLPIHLYDNSHTNFAAQDMGVVGDILNGVVNSVPSLAYRLETSAPQIVASALNSSSILGGMLSKKFGIDPNLMGPPTPSQMRYSNVTNALSAAMSLPGASQIPAQLTTAIEQDYGAVSNPNPTIKFIGPALRDFSFTWYFNPKNQRESMNVKKIIQTIKKASLPTYSTGVISGIMNYPNLCQMNFYPWDQPLESSGRTTNRWGWTENSIIRMKRCFIQSMNVNYNPANVPAFYKDTSPVVYELSLQMKEIEYVTGETWGTESEMDDLFTSGLAGEAERALLAIPDLLSDPAVNLNTFDDTRNAST